ncbi:MAG TPA: tetratricopeptide repeat protein [Asanoa sp.]|nr:tetratricopeptide repeat protein [Asanoa sp.]
MSLPSPLAAALRQAHALRDAGDLTTARAMLADALDRARPMLGDDHPELLGGQHALATMHRESDDPAAARRVLEDAIAAGELHLGEANPLMLALSFDLGTVAEELGNRHEARRNFTRVATYGPAAFGEDHHIVRTAATYLSAAGGGEVPPIPPVQSVVAPPPPPIGGAPSSGPPGYGQPPFSSGSGGSSSAGRPPPGPPTIWPPPAGGNGAGRQQQPQSAGSVAAAGGPGQVTHSPRAVSMSGGPGPDGASFGPGSGPQGGTIAGGPGVGREVAPGVFVVAPEGGGVAAAAEATRAAVNAPTQALPTQPPRAGAAPAQQDSWSNRDAHGPAASGTSQEVTSGAMNPIGWSGPAASAPAGGQGANGQAGNGWQAANGQAGTATGWGGQSTTAPGWGPPGGGQGWGGPPAGSAPGSGPWGRELEPVRPRLPQGLGNRHEPVVSPTQAVEVTPVSLHGPMAAVAARERTRGRSATVAAFVAAVAAVVAAVLVMFVVLRDENDPSRTEAVPEIRAGAPVPSGPALGGEPPTDLAVREDGDALLVTWRDPTAGTVPFIVAAGQAGTQLRAMGTVEPGVTRYLANGLATDSDYCFTVVAVYSTDRYATSGQVCTRRTVRSPG